MVPLLFPLPHVVNWIACLQGAVVPKKICGVRCYYFCASRSVFTLKISKRSVFTLKVSKWTLRPQELCLQYLLFHFRNTPTQQGSYLVVPIWGKLEYKVVLPPLLSPTSLLLRSLPVLFISLRKHSNTTRLHFIPGTWKKNTGALLVPNSRAGARAAFN